VPALLGALDLFCISSTYEGTPLALFEAMAAGKAIVSTAVDGCREVLEDGVTGLLVPPRDAAALAAALLRALDDTELRASLAKRAREASARYDIAAMRRADAGPLRRGPRREGAMRLGRPNPRVLGSAA